MKVRIYGLAVSAEKPIELSELFSHLEKSSGNSAEFSGHNRLLYTSGVDDFYCGLFITIKDQRKYLELKNTGSEAEMLIRSVTEGAHLADFNFFAISKKTGRGLYQHYHNSCSANQFCIFLKRKHDELRNAHIAAELAKIENPTEKQKAAVRKCFSGAFEWQQLVRPETLDALIASFSEVKAFSFDVATISQPEHQFTALGSFAKKVTHRFLFSKSAKLNSLVSGIRDVLKSYQPDSGSLEGLDMNGMEQTIHLSNNFDSFGEFDFDDVAEKMTFLPKDFAGSWFMSELIKAAKGKPALFLTPTK